MKQGTAPAPEETLQVKETPVNYQKPEEKTEIHTQRAVNQGNITAAWQECKRQFSGDMQLQVIAQNIELSLQSATELQCTLQAATQQSTFEQKIQPLIIRHFREVFGVSFSLNIAISEVLTEQKLYTPHEKFEYLAQKNPAVELLKQKLHLEL
ncbi:MAG: hypothetical protein LBU90_10830 [Bacteroidales bacterium]|jgi:hypothetical protein|nr:hypothetical protein [Bacteroidales bacterium]